MATKGAVRDHGLAEDADTVPASARSASARGSRLLAVGCLCCLLAAFVFLQYLLPLGTAVQIGADEGFELAKAELCLSGHRLYSEVWNDQPPLHTFLLTKVVKWAEGNEKGETQSKNGDAVKRVPTGGPGSAGMVRAAHSVLWPRLLTSGFTVLLLVSFFGLVCRVHGLFAAVLATGLLMVSPGFIELSASCMLEIPALALAVCALRILQEGTEETETEREAKGSNAGGLPRLQSCPKVAQTFSRSARMS